MFNYEGYRVLLICGPTDGCKSIDALCFIIMNQFDLDPKEHIIFIFCNRARNRTTEEAEGQETWGSL